ncbi:MAG: alpha/beta fold hydrolase [Candidatus Izemoplasmataceae bacterium]
MATINIHGNRIYYEIKGNLNSLKTLVFLNGVMASTSSWFPLIDNLDLKDLKILLFDFKGQLKSDKPTGPYSFKEHAEELNLLLEQLNIFKAHFIGTSYGAEVGMQFSIMFKDKVESLVLINAASELDASLSRQVMVWKRLAQSYDGYHFFKVMAPMIYHEAYIKTHEADLEKRAQVMKQLDPSYFDGQIALYDTFLDDLNLTESLEFIQTNVLVIGSEFDYLKPLKFSQLIHQKIKHSEYVIIPNCGHVAIFEKPNELATVIMGFIHKNLKN